MGSASRPCENLCLGYFRTGAGAPSTARAAGQGRGPCAVYFSQVVRLRGLEQRWIRLRESSVLPCHRRSGPSVAAWPRALRGVSLVHLGPHHISSLRTGAMRGLNAKKPGASAKIHLSLLEHPGLIPPVSKRFASRCLTFADTLRLMRRVTASVLPPMLWDTGLLGLVVLSWKGCMRLALPGMLRAGSFLTSLGAGPVVTRRCYKRFPPEEQSWLRV